MSRTRIAIALLLAFGLAASATLAADEGRIYGRITTVDGEEFEGLIRWDKNEASWVDILNGTKDVDNNRYDRRRRSRRSSSRSSIKLFGITIGKGSTYFSSGGRQSGIRFGHIRRMEVINDDEVMIELKSGRRVEFSNGSTDIGSSIREIIIEDIDEGDIEFEWDDIEMVEFMETDPTFDSEFGERLYGTLTTRRGQEFTGHICWDVDEVLGDDILDGRAGGRKRKIRFRDITSIERYSQNSALVTLKMGDELVMKGTNDVDKGNRGILVSDPGLGQVKVLWNDFDRVDFRMPDKTIEYGLFDGGRPLEGTVYTEDGDEYTGTIRWDDDEEFTWELLDGNYRKMEFDIEFGFIKEIEKRSYRSSIVTLWDGRSFELRGSNDVDEDNNGIFVILDDGDEVIIDWDDFERVEFSKQ